MSAKKKPVAGKSQPRDDAGTAWARSVVAGDVPSGRLMRGACERHLADLERVSDADFPFNYDPAPGEKFRKFCLCLRHYKGEFAGKPVELVPVQLFVIGCILGWKKKADGLRRFSTAYIEVPRKNGKSAFLSCLSLYMLCMDGEAGAEVYTLGTKRDQAKIVYGDALKMMPPNVKEKFRETRGRLEFNRTNSKMEPLASDANTLDGLNPHSACCDELHAWPDRMLWDVIEDGMGARRQPLQVAITTAGTDKHSFCYDLRKTAVGLCEDAGRRQFVVDSFFGFIAAADPEDAENWRDPRVWLKANPLLGVSKRIEYMADQVSKIEAQPSKLNTFLTKQLNIWTDASERWLNPDQWRAGAFPDGMRLRELLKGKRCWGGLDLARVSDLSAFALVFPPDDFHGFRAATEADVIGSKWKALVWQWCPEDRIRERVKKDKVPYDQWHSDGWIGSTPGNVTDFAHLRADLERIIGEYAVEDIGFDRYFAGEMIQGMQADGVQLVEFGQGFLSMAMPTAELERMLIGGEIVHEGSPVIQWQAGNVVTRSDPAGNLKPDKEKSGEKIDGIVALIMALGRAKVSLAAEDSTPGVYVG